MPHTLVATDQTAVVVVVAVVLDLLALLVTVMQVLVDLILFQVVVLGIVGLQELLEIQAVHIGMALVVLVALHQYQADLSLRQTVEL